ncbi:MAG: glutaredoxin family protein [Betaproteobacteria bacterium]
MPLTCPKCRHVRPSNATVPDWQCPACGVAYVKAAAALRPIATTPNSGRPPSGAEDRQIPWGALIGFVLFAAVVGMLLHASRNKAVRVTDIVTVSAGKADTGMSTLVRSVGPGDVVMYSTTECGYCTQAKNWLNRYGFAFTECNMSVDTRCETEFRELGGTGTPFLLVSRGDQTYRMKNGFDSDEFLALLAR